jgi:sarcosine oxidase subunit delta
MRIECPFCGWRESGEFTYLGDAKPKRPSAVAANGAAETGTDAAFFEYVYMRDNVAGSTHEYWYHGGGCRAWLIVERDTTTHHISSVCAAPGAGAALPSSGPSTGT